MPGLLLIRANWTQKNGITPNQSEGFNFLLKDFQSWKEVPLDSLLMSLKLIQGFYLEEIHRRNANLGTFRLKPKYARYVHFFHKKQQNKTKQFHFAKIVSEYGQEIPQSQTADNPMALFRFLHYCSVFPTTEQKRNSVFLHHCSVFIYHCSVFCTTVPFFTTTEQKRNSVFLYHGCFCTSFPFFFHNGTKKRNSVFLYHCSVFSYH